MPLGVQHVERAFALAREQYADLGVDVDAAVGRLAGLAVSLHCWQGDDVGLARSHPDAGIRRFWVEHGIACRRIGAAMGQALGSPCITNVWVPDGSKDSPVDRKGPRERLARSLDEVFADPIDPRHNRD